MKTCVLIYSNLKHVLLFMKHGSLFLCSQHGQLLLNARRIFKCCLLLYYDVFYSLCLRYSILCIDGLFVACLAMAVCGLSDNSSSYLRAACYFSISTSYHLLRTHKSYNVIMHYLLSFEFVFLISNVNVSFEIKFHLVASYTISSFSIAYNLCQMPSWSSIKSTLTLPTKGRLWASKDFMLGKRSGFVQNSPQAWNS